MTKFFEQLSNIDKEKYLKDIKKYIDLSIYTKISDFITNNTLYITNVKTGIINVKDKSIKVILDNSKNRWFILCIDGKIVMLAKKNIIIHLDIFKYEKRDNTFNNKCKLKDLDYLVEYVENIGTNLSLNIKNYNDKIGKNKWTDESNEIRQMYLATQDSTSLNGYTYNGEDFSLCSIGKNSNKNKEILK